MYSIIHVDLILHYSLLLTYVSWGGGGGGGGGLRHSFKFSNSNIRKSFLYCIRTKKLSCFSSGVEFDMNDIFYEFKYLRYF